MSARVLAVVAKEVLTHKEITLEDALALRHAVGENQDGKEHKIIRKVRAQIRATGQAAHSDALEMIEALVLRGNEKSGMIFDLVGRSFMMALGAFWCGVGLAPATGGVSIPVALVLGAEAITADTWGSIKEMKED